MGKKGLVGKGRDLIRRKITNARIQTVRTARWTRGDYESHCESAWINPNPVLLLL